MINVEYVTDTCWVREPDGGYRLVPTENFKPPDPARAREKRK